MSKSVLYTVNQSIQNVAVDGIINLGTINRRYGNNLDLGGNAILVSGAGYYLIQANITLAPTAEGEVTITMEKDGNAVPGAVASATVAAAGDLVNLSIISIVRESCPCCDGLSNLTFVLSGTAASVSNIATTSIKL